MPSQLAALLPVRIGEYRDGCDHDRAAILLQTLAHFCAPDVFAQVLVVTPESDATVVRQTLSTIDLPGLAFRTDEQICPELSRHRNAYGWVRQMVLKLAVNANRPR